MAHVGRVKKEASTIINTIRMVIKKSGAKEEAKLIYWPTNPSN